MERLNYEVLKRSGYEGYILPEAPEKVLQFGEGNFLRAFADYWFDVANERVGWNGKCVLVQPIKPGLAQLIPATSRPSPRPVWSAAVPRATSTPSPTTASCWNSTTPTRTTTPRPWPTPS